MTESHILTLRNAPDIYLCTYRYVKRIFTILLIVFVNSICLAQDGVLVAAASDLKFALDSVIAVFRQNHAVKISAVYGSPGKLTEQIMHGAPFDLFFSADIEYPKKLKANGKTSSEIYEYARGRLVMWSAGPNTKESLDLLRDPKIKKIAIANPMHAPYGKRAVEVLKNQGIYSYVESRLVYGENISQAAQFVLSGAADVGIIALSLALSPNMKGSGSYFLIPDQYHNPLIQGAVIVKNSSPFAEHFFQFVLNDVSAAIFKYYGFERP